MNRNSSASERQRNHAAYWRDKDKLAKQYPHGWFLAYSGGKIIADAADFDALHENLLAQGKNSPDILVVEAGVEYPKDVVIF